MWKERGNENRRIMLLIDNEGRRDWGREGETQWRERGIKEGGGIC